MWVYYTLFVLSFLALLLSRKTANPERTFLTITAILIVVIIGSRHNWYGFSDEGGYYNLYQNFIDKPFSYVQSQTWINHDYGYYFMNWGLAQIIKWPQFIIYFETAFFVGTVFYFIYKNSPNVVAGVCVLFGIGLFTFCMSAFRQAMAVSFCIIAFEFLKKGSAHKEKNVFREIVGVLFFIVAVSMHRSAWAFAIVLIVAHMSKDSTKKLIAFVFVVLLILFKEQILASGNDLMEKSYASEYHMSATGFIIQMILMIAPILLWLAWKIINNKKKISYLRGNIFFSQEILLSCLGIVLYFMRTYAHIFERVAYYYMIFTVLAYPISIEKTVETQSKKIIYLIVNGLCIVLFLWRIKNGSGAGRFVFFWQTI